MGSKGGRWPPGAGCPSLPARVMIDTFNVYSLTMERLFTNAENENDFAIKVAKEFPALSLEQSGTLRTLALAFYRARAAVK